jgi:hypothetical protein
MDARLTDHTGVMSLAFVVVAVAQRLDLGTFLRMIALRALDERRLDPWPDRLEHLYGLASVR